MTRSQATTRGTQDGIADAETVFAEGGLDALAPTLQPRFSWDEAARNAAAHTYASVPSALVEAYYAAYAQAARARARELVEQHGAQRLEG